MIWLLIALVIVVGFGFVVFIGAPYVPSQRRYLDRAFTKLYKLGPEDVVVDLGSGDGKVLRAASRYGARAVGYEIQPVLVLISRWLSRHDPRVKVRTTNFWSAPLPDDVTLVYVFAVQRDAKRLVKKLTREATRLGRPITVMTLATSLPNLTHRKNQDAYYLYEIQPKEEKV